MWISLVTAVVVLGAIGLLCFVGCEPTSGGTLNLWFVFRYDPALVINGQKVVVTRTDFNIHEEATGYKPSDFSIVLMVGAAPVLSGWTGKGAAYFQGVFNEADSDRGVFRLNVKLAYTVSVQWTVSCNAYGGSRGEITSTLPYEGGVFYFRFTLDKDGLAVPDAS